MHPRGSRGDNHDRVSSATRHQENTGVSILSQTEIAACRTGGDTGYGSAITAEEERYRTAVDGARSAP